MDHYFDRICGASLDLSRNSKEDVIAYLLQQTGKCADIVMVGDTKYDVIGAKHHGIPTIGVSWGYGTIQDLTTAGAEAIVDTMDELLIYLRNR